MINKRRRQSARRKQQHFNLLRALSRRNQRRPAHLRLRLLKKRWRNLCQRGERWVSIIEQKCRGRKIPAPNEVDSA